MTPNTDVLTAIPDTIDRERVLDFVRSLGLDPEGLREFRLTARDARGLFYAVGDELATHHIHIPLEDPPA